MTLITLSGPSGAGKSTLLDYIKKNYNAHVLPSWTTRKRRSNSPGESIYNYVSRNAFTEKINSNDFLLIEKVADNYYGTTFEDIKTAISSSKLWLTDLTANSVLDMIKKQFVPSYSLIMMISKETSYSRMTERGDNESSINKRLLRYNNEVTLCEILTKTIKDTCVINGELDKKIIFKNFDEYYRINALEKY